MEWYADEYLREMAAMTDAEEKASAKRVQQRARKLVNKHSASRFVAVPFYGKSWQGRSPGRLARSIKRYRARYPQKAIDRGFLVYAGNTNAYYAHWVEFGTILMRRWRKGKKYMRRAVTLEKAYFTRRIRKRLGV